MTAIPGRLDYAAMHAADQASFRKHNCGSLHRLDKPMANGVTHSGTLLVDGVPHLIEARIVEAAGGRKHFELIRYPAHRELLRTATVSGEVSAIPPDLVTMMDRPFDDPLPPIPAEQAVGSAP